MTDLIDKKDGDSEDKNGRTIRVSPAFYDWLLDEQSRLRKQSGKKTSLGNMVERGLGFASGTVPVPVPKPEQIRKLHDGQHTPGVSSLVWAEIPERYPELATALMEALSGGEDNRVSGTATPGPDNDLDRLAAAAEQGRRDTKELDGGAHGTERKRANDRKRAK